MQVLSGKNQSVARTASSRRPLRLGFVPLTDCAPLVVAQEMGWFRQAGVEVRLSRELGWASVRDKLLFGELDAAHALAPMVFLLALGLGGQFCPCFTPLILNLQGNAITVSRRLWEAGVRDAAGLRAWRSRAGAGERLTFGIVFPHSFHHFLLRDWLESGGVSLKDEVQFVVVPPPQMVANLKAGHLDGFCAGEPWNALAEETGAGRCAARSSDLAPRHPEKALLVRQAVWMDRREELLAMAAALLGACAYCAGPDHAAAIADLLAQRRFVGVSRSALASSLSDPDEATRVGERGLAGSSRILFHGPDVNDPTADKAGPLVRHLCRASLLREAPRPSQLGELFRADLFQTIRQQKNRFTNHDYALRSEPHHTLV